MPLRTKIAVVALVIILGAGAALVFRKSPATPSDDAPQPRQTVAAREDAHMVSEKPAPVSHLAGRIDLGARGANHGAPLGAQVAEPNRGTTDNAGSASSITAGMTPLPSRDAVAPFASGATLREQVRHRIVDGDTLSSLAQRYLGSADRYTEIYQLNRDVLPDPNLLPIGAELRIPSTAAPSEADRLKSPPMVPIDPRPSTTPVATQTALSSTRGGPVGSTYRVERSDTLSGIAKKIYGDASRYHELLELNRSQLARPEDLREGMILSLP